MNHSIIFHNFHLETFSKKGELKSTLKISILNTFNIAKSLNSFKHQIKKSGNLANAHVKFARTIKKKNSFQKNVTSLFI